MLTCPHYKNLFSPDRPHHPTCLGPGGQESWGSRGHLYLRK